MNWMMIIMLLIAVGAYSQDEDNVPDQQLEDLAETEEHEMEDEYTVQQLSALKRDPLNINDPSASFTELPALNAMLVNNLVSYRNLLGPFISVYELQAVPGFTVDVI